jgi:hypothetical protein
VIQIFVLLLREFLRFEKLRGLRTSKQQNSNLFAAAAGPAPLYMPAFCGFPGSSGHFRYSLLAALVFYVERVE